MGFKKRKHVLEMLEIESADFDLVILNPTRRPERKSAAAASARQPGHAR